MVMSQSGKRRGPTLQSWIFFALAVLTILRLVVAARAELLPEEAYYWTYWQHPAMGYFDHPPMVAWIIGLGTWLFGNNELGIRFGAILISLGSCGLMYALGKRWFNSQVASWAVLLFLMLPIYGGMGFLAFPDGPLVFFWLLTLYAVTRAVQDEPRRAILGRRPTVSAATAYWLLAGLAFGLALLSKYPAVLMAPSLLLFLLLSSRHRGWISRPQPWLALVVALLVFSPVIAWNAHHTWASFLFQSTRTVGQKIKVSASASVFWLFQLGALTPVGLALFGLAAVKSLSRGWTLKQDCWNFAIAFSLPLFLVFLLASFKTEIHVNWTAPAFLSLCPAAAALFLEGIDDPSPQRARYWRLGGVALAIMCGASNILLMSGLTVGTPPYHDAGGWRQLAESVTEVEGHLGESTQRQPFVIGGDKYYLAAELGFYTHTPKDLVNGYALGEPGVGYRYWTDLSKFVGRPAIAVLTRATTSTLSKLEDHFDKIDPPVQIEIPMSSLSTHKRVVYLVNCYGYHI